jgi:cell division septation protein DedD
MAKMTVTKAKADTKPTVGGIGAVSAIRSAWKTYQSTEKHCIAFGKTLCAWRDKFHAQGSRCGGGLAPILEEVGIPNSTAYWWMNRYEVTVGKKSAKPNQEVTPKSPRPQAPLPVHTGRTMREPASKPASEPQFVPQPDPEPQQFTTFETLFPERWRPVIVKGDYDTKYNVTFFLTEAEVKELAARTS